MDRFGGRILDYQMNLGNKNGFAVENQYLVELNLEDLECMAVHRHYVNFHYHSIIANAIALIGWVKL